MDRKEQIKALWKSCFNDSEAFVRLFFEQIYRAENALTEEHEGKVIAALQMLPYEMMWLGKKIKVSYIYGACTDPSWRNRGVMSRLLQRAFRVMAQRGIALTVLIPAEPALFHYYSRLGYVTLFHYAQLKAHRAPQPAATDRWHIQPVDPTLLPALYPRFCQFMESRPCTLLHSYPDLAAQFADNCTNGGEWLMACDRDGEVQGILFLTPTDQGLTAIELLTRQEEVKSFLLQTAMQRNRMQTLSYYAPATADNCHPLGMARLISPAPLIDHWIEKHPASPLTAHELKAMAPDALIRQLFCSDSLFPYMSLMMNEG